MDNKAKADRITEAIVSAIRSLEGDGRPITFSEFQRRHRGRMNRIIESELNAIDEEEREHLRDLCRNPILEKDGTMPFAV